MKVTSEKAAVGVKDRSTLTTEDARKKDEEGDAANVYKHGNETRIAMYHQSEQAWRWPLAEATADGGFKLLDFSEPMAKEHDFDAQSKWDGIRVYRGDSFVVGKQ